MTARKDRGIGTQRAWAAYGKSSGMIFGATPGQGDNDIPVLIVPEADVKGCKHSDDEEDGLMRVCRDCGSLSVWNFGGDQWGRWQGPRILRVRKEAKK